MDANFAPTESYDRHHRLYNALRAGLIDDPERWLFLKLLDDPPPALAATPYLYEVSWGGRFDLLFTDGRATWCAVEVKDAPEVYGSSKPRKNRRKKRNRKWDMLLEQTREAWGAASARFPGALVLGLALWRTDDWMVIGEHGSRVLLAA